MTESTKYTPVPNENKCSHCDTCISIPHKNIRTIVVECITIGAAIVWNGFMAIGSGYKAWIDGSKAVQATVNFTMPEFTDELSFSTSLLVCSAYSTWRYGGYVLQHIRQMLKTAVGKGRQTCPKCGKRMQK